MSFTFLSVGGMIYLGWRSRNIVLFQLLEKWKIFDFLNSIRNSVINYSLYDWVKYSLPDGLWLFSYMFIINAIWHDHKNVSYYVFIWSLPVIAIMFELLQYMAIVPGTFDIIDLSCYILAIVIFLILNMN